MSKDALLHQLNGLLNLHAYKRVNGRQASHVTATGSGQVLRTAFADLWNLGYRLQRPQSLAERHVQSLVQHWYSKPLAIGTIQERLSRLRVFCGWIGKKGMIKSLKHYLPEVDPARLRVPRVAASSKSWSSAGIDIPALLTRADALDMRIGLMIRMQLWFGLRRKEVLHLQPWAHDGGAHLSVIEGKGGRPRTIPIEHPGQRRILDQVKAVIGKHEHLGWYHTARGQQASLKYNYGRYNKLLAALGLTRVDFGATGHGARHQALENLMMLQGVVPATQGGESGQLDAATTQMIRIRVSNAAGHNRPGITSAYCGSFGRSGLSGRIGQGSDPASRLARALASLGPCAAPPAAQRADCLRLVSCLAEIGCDCAPGQIHRLWQIASARFAVPWFAPPEQPLGLIRYAVAQVLRGNIKKNEQAGLEAT